MISVLKTACSGAVLRLTLNDDASRNSLSEAMLDAVESQLKLASADRSISVIIIAGDGVAFSSGHNLKQLSAHRVDADHGEAYFKVIFEQCARVMMAIAQHRCVTIAEVQGLASAAGCQMVASCDFAFANEHAKFCTPGVNIGLFCSTPMVALSRAVSPRHAREMLLSGDVYDASHAVRIGLVNKVLDSNSLTNYVSDFAARIAAKSQGAIDVGKPAFDAQAEMNLGVAYAHCSKLMVENFMNVSAREGVGAVLEKRKPVWPST